MKTQKAHPGVDVVSELMAAGFMLLTITSSRWTAQATNCPYSVTLSESTHRCLSGRQWFSVCGWMDLSQCTTSGQRWREEYDHTGYTG